MPPSRFSFPPALCSKFSDYPNSAVICFYWLAQIPLCASHPQCSFHFRGAVLGRLPFFVQPTLLGFCAFAAAESVTASNSHQMLRPTGCFPRGFDPPARHRLIPSRRSPTICLSGAEAPNVYLIAASPRPSFPRIRSSRAAYCSPK